MNRKVFPLFFVFSCFFPFSVFSGEWAWQNPLPQGNDLNAVWGSSATDVFAVGNKGTILHYDGKAWALKDSGVTDNLYAVWGTSASDVFAVGGDIHGVILHYDGTAWSIMEDRSDISEPRSIWGSSSDDIYVVGGGVLEDFILHYDGKSWQRLYPAQLIRLRLYDVWGSSASDVFVVGANIQILHYNGINWSEIDTGIDPQNLWPGIIFTGVWGNSASEVFIVGYENNGPGRGFGYYDGTRWFPLAIKSALTVSSTC